MEQTIKQCLHPHIFWKFSQFNPDCGVCHECGKLVYAENASSEIHTEDEPGYKNKIMAIIKKI